MCARRRASRAKKTIRLEARQEGDQIIISVADDGAGIDPARIARKATEKGLVTTDRLRTMTTREILDFIFLPGFSTAEKISDLSGRGVGMDVVRSNLTKLNGTIDLESKLGVGTTVSLRLPLTLAILPVLLVEVGNEIYALPLRSVVETARIHAAELHRFEGYELLHLRGETVPLLRLGKMFKLQPDAKGSDKVVILEIGERRIALLVDNFLGQESTVIKPLGPYLHHCSGIAGATISGDGRVRLVLDPADLLASASNSAAQGLIQ
jgi:two-component system, chemotaxis family, sensor kinase CheA